MLRNEKSNYCNVFYRKLPIGPTLPRILTRKWDRFLFMERNGQPSASLARVLENCRLLTQDERWKTAASTRMRYATDSQNCIWTLDLGFFPSENTKIKLFKAVLPSGWWHYLNNLVKQANNKKKKDPCSQQLVEAEPRDGNCLKVAPNQSPTCISFYSDALLILWVCNMFLYYG